MVEAATQLNDLRKPPGNKLHPLESDRKGQHAIWINDQYRVCFEWKDGHAHDVEITDYHDKKQMRGFDMSYKKKNIRGLDSPSGRNIEAGIS